jgi:hypothetical protein
MKRKTVVIVLNCAIAKEELKKTEIDLITSRLKNLTLEQLVEIEHFMDDNLMV